jgi:hypothetical protein
MRPRLFRLLPPLGAALLAAALLAVPTLSADPQDATKEKGKTRTEELREKVKALVQQLADKDPDKQDEAAALLLKLGPDVLPFLPRPGDKLTEGQKKALAVVRKTLRDEQIKRDLAPRLVTLDDELPLSKALAEVAKQTGNPVEDRREADEDTKIKVKLDKVTFWEAMDTIAREADARVSVYERDGKVALRRRPEGYQNPPTSYNGLFRTVVRRVEARRDLDSDASRYQASLEIAWEPRFRPFFIEMRPQAFRFKDDKGRDQAAAEEDQGNNPNNKLAVTNLVAQVFDVPLPALERSSAKLGLLKGSVTMVGPTRFETFEFPSTLAEMQKDPRLREVSKEGVTVRINKLDLAKDHWTLEVRLEYPADGPQFESFDSWLVYNKMMLRKKGGNGEYPPNGGDSIDDSGGNRAVLSYHFVDDAKDNLKRGDPTEWTPVYKSPGLIVEVPAQFEFKDIPLP